MTDHDWKRYADLIEELIEAHIAASEDIAATLRTQLPELVKVLDEIRQELRRLGSGALR